MKTMVIGDIHQAPNLEQVEAAIARESPDRVVFLGDYFDQFDDIPDDAMRTAQWLKYSLSQPGRVHLWGNHDLPYAFPNNPTVDVCSGYTEGKLRAIASVLTEADWMSLKAFQWLSGRMLATHAGWSRHFAPMEGEDMATFLTSEVDRAWAALKSGSPHWVWASGRSRGGEASTGGLLWCDVDEFQPISGIDQVFGHTPEKFGVFRKGLGSRNWCVDTADRSGVHHYLRVERDSVSVHRLDGSIEEAWIGKGA